MNTIVLLVMLSVLPGKEILLSTEKAEETPYRLYVDARPVEAYEAGHIPGAVQVDAFALSEDRDGVVGLLGPFVDIATALGNQGVNPAKNLIVYSGFEEPGDVKRATRLFWILEYMGYDNVALLDGGLAQWKADGRPIEEGPSTAEPVSTESLIPHEDRIATLSDVLLQVEQKGGVADFRSEEEFTGETQPKSTTKAGHIPSAVNLPEASFVEGETNTFLSVEAIEKKLAEQGLSKDDDVVSYCNTGRSASVGYFVLRLAGYDKVKLYDGSMSEWTARGQSVVCPADLSGPGAKEK